MKTTIIMVEVPVEKKVQTKAFKTLAGAREWAKARVTDEAIPSASVWRYSAAEGSLDCLMRLAEGHPWWDERELLVVIAKSTTKVSR